MDLLNRVLESRIEGVALALQLWDGSEISGQAKPVGKLTVKSPWALRHFLRPTFSALAEAYVKGELDYEGDTREVVAAIGDFLPRQPRSSVNWKPRPRGKRRDRKAVQFHYDVSDDFFRLWLDPKRVYSCAYFPTGHETLEAAQEEKLDYICRKLMLRPGESFLDVGCGWGALAVWAATRYGVRATGITLSRNQYRYAVEQVRRLGLTQRVKILLRDYREIPKETRFDKIASIGMFEHVGLVNLPSYFAKLHDALREGGLLLNHGICASPLDQRYCVPGDTGSFIDRYVFPEEELPHVSHALREMAAPGLEITDVESLRPHYAKTLSHWLDRLEANHENAVSIVGEERYRIWRVYLAGCALAFERGWINVYQMLGSKTSASGKWELPMSREHLYRATDRAYSAWPRASSKSARASKAPTWASTRPARAWKSSSSASRASE